MCDYRQYKTILTSFLPSKAEKSNSRSVFVHSNGTYFFLSIRCFFRVQTLFLGEVNNSACEVGQNILHKVGGVHRAGNSNVVLGNFITWNSQRIGINGENARNSVNAEL